MTNDGTKAYDHGRDGAGQEAGRCSVRTHTRPYQHSRDPCLTDLRQPLSLMQIDFRRTEISAKGKLTYFKNQFLEVSSFGSVSGQCDSTGS